MFYVVTYKAEEIEAKNLETNLKKLIRRDLNKKNQVVLPDIMEDEDYSVTYAIVYYEDHDKVKKDLI